MQNSLQTQLALAETTFLTCLTQGPEALESFYQSWFGPRATFMHALMDHNMDEGTSTIIHQVLTRIEIIASRFIEHYEEAEAITTSFQNDLDIMFANLSIDSEPSSSAIKKFNAGECTIQPIVPDVIGSIPSSYLETAYIWLLANLHNPYPSKEAKITMAQETHSSLKDVESWFINVRKRIGWNKLRLKHYANKRSRVVAAATRFFKGTQSDQHATYISGTGMTANHDSEFKSIESRAKGLYSGGLLEKPLVTKLDGAIGDIPSEIKTRKVARDIQCLFVYPSPEPSPDRSPESAISPLPIPNAAPATRKRRNYDCDSPEFDDEDRRDEPRKRSRLDSYRISHELPVASLPSPAASLSDNTRERSATPSASEIDCIVLPTPPIPTVPSGKRKRRLSDAGHDGASKRPHNALAVPRLQTVSDPLPLANPIISDLYKFDPTISDSIPDPVSVESLDGTQVEVDFYNYGKFPDIIQSLLFVDSSLGPYPAVPYLAIPEPLSLDKSQVSDPNLDFLQFENYSKDIPPQVTDMPFVADIPSLDHSTWFPFENSFPNQLPQEGIFSDPYFESHSPWDFQGIGDNFSTIVPSIGSLFSSDPVHPQIDSAQNDKEVKRKKIEALRAQLQSLEAEP